MPEEELRRQGPEIKIRNSMGRNGIAKQPPGDDLMTAKQMLRKGRRPAGWHFIELDQEKKEK